MSSFLKLFLAFLLTCAPTAQAICYAPAQDDAWCKDQASIKDVIGTVSAIVRALAEQSKPVRQPQRSSAKLRLRTMLGAIKSPLAT